MTSVAYVITYWTGEFSDKNSHIFAVYMDKQEADNTVEKLVQYEQWYSIAVTELYEFQSKWLNSYDAAHESERVAVPARPKKSTKPEWILLTQKEWIKVLNEYEATTAPIVLANLESLKTRRELLDQALKEWWDNRYLSLPSELADLRTGDEAQYDYECAYGHSFEVKEVPLIK